MKNSTAKLEGGGPYEGIVGLPLGIQGMQSWNGPMGGEESCPIEFFLPQAPFPQVFPVLFCTEEGLNGSSTCLATQADLDSIPNMHMVLRLSGV